MMSNCPRCQRRFIFTDKSVDFEHDCDSKSEALDNEDVVVMGDWTDYTSSPNSPVSHYRFNENTGTVTNDVFSSGSAVLNANISWGTGKIGNALVFANSGLATSTTGNFTRTATDSFTYAFWMYPTGYPGGNLGRIFEDGYNDWYPGHLRNQQQNGSMFQVLLIRYDGTNNPDVRTGYVIPINEWSHITAKYDVAANHLFIYRNGEVVGSKTDSTVKSNQTGAQSTTVFGNISGLTRSYVGRLDDFRYYNIALSDREIKAIYNNGSGIDGSEVDIPVETKGNNAEMQGSENKLFGTRGWIEGQDVEKVTRRGARASTHRQRKHLEFIKLQGGER